MTTERDAVVRLAIGRLFRLLSRPYQPGDGRQYEQCRRVVLNQLDPIDPGIEHRPVREDPAPCWARDRLRGAKGD